MKLIRKGLLFVVLTVCFTPGVSEGAITSEQLREIRSTPSSFVKVPLERPLTQKEQVFFEEVLTKLRSSANGRKLLKTAEHVGYQFGGFSSYESTACTTINRHIFIKRDIPVDLAVLSLAWELSNIINLERAASIEEQARLGKIKRYGYAKNKIKIEAEAAYWESVVAKDLGIKHWLTIKSNVPTDEGLLKIIYKHLKNFSKVNEQLSAMDFYMNQYDAFYK